MCESNSSLSRLARNPEPICGARGRYWGCVSKKTASDASAFESGFRSLMSRCERLTTPTKPRLSGITLPWRTSRASVPSSMRSSLVMTPIVRSPCGSTLRASWIASDVAMSAVAGETARMIAFGLRMYCITIRWSCASMSTGWSSTGTLVTPGRSTSDRSSTCGERMHSWMGSAETRFDLPSLRVVSASISAQMSRKL